MNAHSQIAPPMILQVVSFEEVRRVIDRVATIRARNIRVAFFATLLFRPDPGRPTTDEQRAGYLDILRRQVEVIHTVTNTLCHGARLPDAPAALTDWLFRIAGQRPDDLQTLHKLDRISQRVLKAAEVQSADQRAALAEHLAFGRSGVFEKVTRICDSFWDDLALQQAQELDRANQAAEALSQRLSRLERIGKHVRLVSLNASVEASRAGQAGKGLMVIAHEFKSLAEEIQSLAEGARIDMGRLQ